MSDILNIYIFAPLFENLSVAQLAEQLTLNQRVQGSNPCGETDKKPVPAHGLLALSD